MVKPISPNEVVEKKKADIPDGVIEVFNNLITKKFSNGEAIILQKEILSALALKMHVSKDKVIANGWLNVEEIFVVAGWEVEHYEPYNKDLVESYFAFTKKEV